MDPDPGGPNTCDPVDPDSDQDPEHWFEIWHSTTREMENISKGSVPRGFCHYPHRTYTDQQFYVKNEHKRWKMEATTKLKLYIIVFCFWNATMLFEKNTSQPNYPLLALPDISGLSSLTILDWATCQRRIGTFFDYRYLTLLNHRTLLGLVTWYSRAFNSTIN